MGNAWPYGGRRLETLQLFHWCPMEYVKRGDRDIFVAPPPPPPRLGGGVQIGLKVGGGNGGEIDHVQEDGNDGADWANAKDSED